MLITRMTQESETTYKVEVVVDGDIVEDDRYDDVTDPKATARTVLNAYIAKTGYDGSSGVEVISLPSDPVDIGFGYPSRFRQASREEEIKITWKTPT